MVVLLNAAPFLAFLFLVAAVLPWTGTQFGLHIPLVVAPFGSLSEHVQVYRLGLSFHVNWSLPFFLMMTVTGFSQWLAIALHTLPRPSKMFRCIAEFTFIALATLPCYAIHCVSFLLTRKGTFQATGGRRAALAHSCGAIFSILPWIDVGMAGVLACLFTTTFNAWLLTFVAALALHPLLIRIYTSDWTRSGINWFVYLPFALVLVVVLLMGVSFL
jgi:hypothetical protein